LGAALGAVGVLVFGISAFGAASAAAPATPPEPKVTVIGDSVMTGILWYRDATEILEQDLALRMEVAVCRRLTGTSCTFEGVTPPNLVQLSQSLGRQLGPTVVVEMGYNDREVTFAQSLEASINALLRAGVTRIVWANLREARHPYVRMNDTLVAAAKRHPEVMIADWNKYSRSHPDWFQNDDLHVVPEGGIALATFLHASIVRALATPLPIVVQPTPLPIGRVGRPYAVRLHASGGKAPYRYRLAVGQLPKGLTLRAAGLITGTPVRSARVELTLRVSDAGGRAAVRADPLEIKG
jgi:Putative Ig domain